MRKSFCVCLMVMALLVAGGVGKVLAADGGAQSGVYVAPKLGFGYVIMDKAKFTVDAPYLSTPSFSTKDDGNDSVFALGLAVGYDFKVKHNLPVRAELEYMYYGGAEDSFTYFDKYAWIDTKIKNEYDIQTLFANFYYDFETGTAFTPYVGGGIGLALIDNKGSATLLWSSVGWYDEKYKISSNDSTNFAWNIGGGVGFDLTDNLTLDLNYRFAGLGEAETKKTDVTSSGAILLKNKTSNLYMHQALLSLRYTF